MILAIGFAVLASCALVSAYFVARSEDLVHAVLWLAASLLVTAAIYAMLGASVLAGVQALVYVGGVITLMIFGLMITRRHDTAIVRAESQGIVRGGLVASALFALLAWAILATPGLDAPVDVSPLPPAELGRALVQRHVLAFEVLSVLLLAAMVGAIVIARRRDPGDEPARAPAPSPAPSSASSEVTR